MSRSAIWANLVLISILWGAAFPLVRFVVSEMSPLAMTAARGCIAAAALGLFLWAIRADLAGFRAVWRHALVLGALNGFIPNILNGMALQRIESLPGALVQSTTPIFIAILGAFVLREDRLTASRIAGVGLGFAGVAVIMGPAALAGGATMWGVLLMLGVAACYAAATCYMRWARPDSSATLVVCQQLAYALPATGVALAVLGPAGFAVSTQVWLGVAVLAIVASAVPLTLFVRTLKHATAGQASVVGYLQPVAAALAGAALLGEAPEWRVVAGGGVVLVACWLMNRD